jgi:hypothetical protein
MKRRWTKLREWLVNSEKGITGIHRQPRSSL